MLTKIKQENLRQKQKWSKKWNFCVTLPVYASNEKVDNSISDEDESEGEVGKIYFIFVIMILCSEKTHFTWMITIIGN